MCEQNRKRIRVHKKGQYKRHLGRRTIRKSDFGKTTISEKERGESFGKEGKILLQGGLPILINPLSGGIG